MEAGTGVGKSFAYLLPVIDYSIENNRPVVISTNTGMPLILLKKSTAGAAFRRIAMRLNGMEDLPIKVPRSQEHFWKRLTAKLGIGK